uniref:Uncharacterized protein n=1 Tax=Timema poppense TaxID=170557 RepID=A0A7R9HAN5_TIMPO|nr:unnamed protein product [Timema poppensis]
MGRGLGFLFYNLSAEVRLDTSLRGIACCGFLVRWLLLYQCQITVHLKTSQRQVNGVIESVMRSSAPVILSHDLQFMTSTITLPHDALQVKGCVRGERCKESGGWEVRTSDAQWSLLCKRTSSEDAHILPQTANHSVRFVQSPHSETSWTVCPHSTPDSHSESFVQSPHAETSRTLIMDPSDNGKMDCSSSCTTFTNTEDLTFKPMESEEDVMLQEMSPSPMQPSENDEEDFDYQDKECSGVERDKGDFPALIVESNPIHLSYEMYYQDVEL